MRTLGITEQHRITVTKNGPLSVRGPFRLVGGDAARVWRPAGWRR